MAAPLGFKTFTTGEVLTAADTNGYLMQGVLVFADAAARTTAITSPQEGQTSYLKDTDEIQVYSGSAWVTKSGGLPSQTGNSGKYLTTDGTNASWGTVAAGSMTQLATGTVSGTSVVLSSISQSYKHLYLVLTSAQLSAATDLAWRLNADTGTNYAVTSFKTNSTALAGRTTDTLLYANSGNGPVCPITANDHTYILFIQNYASSKGKNISVSQNLTGAKDSTYGWATYTSGTAISSITLCTSAGTATFSVGTYTLFGVN